MVTLLKNTKENNHLKVIREKMKDATAINMAVAFFKTSGLNALFPYLHNAIKIGTPVNIIVGVDFALTDPDALMRVYKLFKKSSNANLYLANPKGTFHPKIYMISQDDEHAIICGSANCTNGGLLSNEECSLNVEARTGDSIVNEVGSYFSQLVKEDFVRAATYLSILNYKNFFERQKKTRKYIEQKPIRHELDYEILKEYLLDWKAEENVSVFHQEKRQAYLEAKEVLNNIASTSKMTSSQFRGLYEMLVGVKGNMNKSLWYSGSIYRHKERTIRDANKFRQLVRKIKANIKKSPQELWSMVKDMKVDGVGVNIKAEIMMTYSPSKFPNLNNNPIRSLQEAGCYLKNPNSFKGEDYQAYSDLLKEIGSELDLKNMLEIDSFFNNIYWQVK